MYCSSFKLPDWPSWLSLRKEISMTWVQSALKAVACWQLYTWGLAPSCLCYAIAFPCSSWSLPWAQVQAEPCWLSGKYSRGKVDITVIWEPPVQELDLGGWDVAFSQLYPPKVYPSDYMLCRRSLKEVLVLLTCLISGSCWDIDFGVTPLAVSVTT